MAEQLIVHAKTIIANYVKFIQNYHNDHTKFNFGMIIVVCNDASIAIAIYTYIHIRSYMLFTQLIMMCLTLLN